LLVVWAAFSKRAKTRAWRAGADAIIVSNHGGRQFDRAVNAIDCLPAIREAVGMDFPVMFDGGVRRGSDVLALLCCGVDYVFAGRPFLYSAAGFGQGGVHRAAEIFTDELSGLMRQLGCVEIENPALKTFMVDKFGTLIEVKMGVSQKFQQIATIP
jgi:isopentenyl diphosphate isomerase/L-lactate dehydrogenase-like FMN-dependent dehydrogenase